MRIVYAIFSHHKPAQVIRLAHALRHLSPSARIVVHHDPAHSELPASALEHVGAQVIPNPVKGEWGDYSLVAQHLHTMDWCRKNVEFDWYVNLTGQSYPIRPLLAFENMLEHSSANAYIDYFDAFDPGVWPKGEATKRYHYRYYKLPTFRYWHRVPAWLRERVPQFVRKINSSQSLLSLFTFPRGLPTRLGLVTRRRPFSQTHDRLYGANLNMNLDSRCIDTLLERVACDRDYVRYFARTVISDEVFFSTVLCNRPDLDIVNDNLRHIHWPEGNAASVAVMDMTHRKALEGSAAFFALKFDMDTCPELLDYLDKMLGIPPMAERS